MTSDGFSPSRGQKMIVSGQSLDRIRDAQHLKPGGCFCVATSLCGSFLRCLEQGQGHGSPNRAQAGFHSQSSLNQRPLCSRKYYTTTHRALEESNISHWVPCIVE
jgi:hypothetical protein